MSKIICDVCGTSYPDTATQCPICGCVRTADSKSVSSRSKSSKDSGSYTYVKGGRFSKANVKKRNKASGVVSVNVVKDGRSGGKKADNSSNRGLVATVIILLVAIVAVALYITFRFFVPALSQQTPATDVQTSPTETTEEQIACSEIALDVFTLTLDKVGDTHVITAAVNPADTTDEIEFVSADEKIATVVADGNKATVKAVAPGQTMIIAKCGSVKASCTVECAPEGAEDETTEPTVAIPEGAVLELTRKDMTLVIGETWDLKMGDIPAEAISWKSEKPSVATVENGIVKCVGIGKTVIYAECNDQKVSCDVYGKYPDNSSGVPGSGGGISEDG